MNINQERLWSNIQELGQIGEDPKGGITRLSFTESEREAKKLVKQYMENAGLRVWEDAIGNLFGRKEGQNPKAPAVMIGSHIDSVFNGGIFDGPAGVLTGIEVLHTLHEQNKTTIHPVEVVSFTDEEGARFSTGMLGSSALIGQLSDHELTESIDQNGVSIATAMEKFGYNLSEVKDVKRDPSTIKGYLELHIEQGKILEQENLPVGIVSGIVGVTWLKVKLKGEAGHAGTTPMWLRKDPLAAAAIILTKLEELAKLQERTVITVGRISAEPGGVNIIPSEVEFTIDLRDLSMEVLQKVEKQLHEEISIVCNTREIEFVIEDLHRLPSAICSDALKGAIYDSVSELGIKPIELPSGAGHDAMIMSRASEMGMIFVRSKDGISHNPKEWSDKEDLGIGAEVLYKAVLKLANEE
ncbi:Zn-dependent hydrolase [Litchfieldia salsa]|uniref:Allantoate deiminase n=1 Tax=Litchfieldia salsa TaxID=930152 RepID=A0A1H0RRL9_9BACI|nr:Zn-dependent hydrolase [Litchfieldia salsa]SDP32045.1 allantoate deiminase [Litchfieldia salsa]